jgi:hypothetical protein
VELESAGIAWNLGSDERRFAMTTNGTTTRDKFFDAINEAYDALITGIEATEQRGHKASGTLLGEARKAERELATLARTWVDSPRSVYENMEAMIDAQTRAQRRALELARDSLGGAGTYRKEVQESLRRMIRANRAVAEVMLEVARAGTSRAAKQVERLPRPRRVPSRAARPTRIPVTGGHVERRKAG